MVGTPGRRGDPRACGGATRRRHPSEGHPGRSPRMRGSRLLAGDEPADGAIPAHAGEPQSGSPVDPSGGDPRACGGAPPEASRPGEEGAIPAHAGEPARCRRQSGSGGDPRACGGAGAAAPCGGSPRGAIPAHAGEPGLALAFWRWPGRSPRMRGACQAPSPKKACGAIPAHAGEPEGELGAVA